MGWCAASPHQTACVDACAAQEVANDLARLPPQPDQGPPLPLPIVIDDPVGFIQQSRPVQLAHGEREAALLVPQMRLPAASRPGCKPRVPRLMDAFDARPSPHRAATQTSYPGSDEPFPNLRRERSQALHELTMPPPYADTVSPLPQAAPRPSFAAQSHRGCAAPHVAGPEHSALRAGAQTARRTRADVPSPTLAPTLTSHAGGPGPAAGHCHGHAAADQGAHQGGGGPARGEGLRVRAQPMPRPCPPRP